MKNAFEMLKTAIQMGCPERAKEDILAHLEEYDLRSLIVPDGGKSCWQMCAEILVSLPDEAFLPLIPDVFAWFQDLNWPGAQEISARMQKLEFSVFGRAWNEARKTAQQEGDEEWLWNLSEMFRAFPGWDFCYLSPEEEESL